jgi:predicted RNase H-like HicB family nuclease
MPGGTPILATARSKPGHAATHNALPANRNTTFYVKEYPLDIVLTAVYQKVPEGYIGFVEELPGANTQGRTLTETRTNLEEAVRLVLEANRLLAEERLVGTDVIRERVRG